MKGHGIICGLLASSVTAAALAQNDGDLSAGGLAPPAAIESESDRAAREQQTEAELQEAEREDSGRGLEFLYLNGEVGVQHLGLGTLRQDNLIDDEAIPSQQTGPVYGAGLGVRLVFVTLGARFRLASFSEWQLWTLGAEAGLRIPLGSIEPYFTLGGGYASLGSFDEAGLDVSGFDVRGGFGLDYYLTEMFSLGGNLSGDLLFLSRPEVDGATASAGELDAQLYGRSGSSTGVGVTLTLVVGLHF